MLAEFRVENFKNFKNQVVFQLDQVKNYEFGSEAVKNGIVKTGLVYGENGSGKSNLGLAIFDITLHLTDKQKDISDYRHYINLESKENAKFYYKFKFGDTCLEYIYEKSEPERVINEKLFIDSRLVIFYDHIKHEGNVKLLGAETLKTDLTDSNISFVKYIGRNAVLSASPDNVVMKRFFEFVDDMLLFSSLERNHYQGFRNGRDSIGKEILERGKLYDFEEFLREAGLDYHLTEVDVDGEPQIFCKFQDRTVKFFSIISKGTASLALFYFWLMQFDQILFVVIDEFDAFYHNNLARHVVKKILSTGVQAIMTTHNTSIMDNELLRPDCYFNLVNGSITSIANSTDKELRRAHNLEKMYRAGSFNE